MSTARPAIPRKLEKTLYQEVNSRCPCCGETDVQTLTIHHIIKYADLSQHFQENMIVLCANCHRRADNQEITPDRLYELRKQLKKAPLEARSPAEAVAAPTKVTGTVAAGRDVNIRGNLILKTTRAARLEHAPRAGTVAEDPFMVGYLDHLVKRFNECKERELENTNTAMNYAIIRKNYEHEIGFPVRHTPIELFERAAGYLKRRIDNTLEGRMNRSRDTKNYSGFQEWKTKRLSKA